MQRVLLILLASALTISACAEAKLGMGADSISGEGVFDGTGKDGVIDGVISTDGVADSISDVDTDSSAAGKDRRYGEVSSGAATSKGGNYVLHSQVGLWSAPQRMSGGAYTLRWNATVHR